MAKTMTASKGKAVSATVKTKTKRQGGYTSKKAARGTGLKFKVETFATVSKFVPGTRLKYGPNPKRPGSKSFTRYAGYAKAKTVGEALKFGSKKEDFLWELERGDYKLLGGARTEAQEVAAIGKPAFDRAKAILSSFAGPAGCPVNFKDPKAGVKLEKEEAWRAERMRKVEKRAKDMGLKVETTEEIEASTESADIRLQRRVAEAIAMQKLQSKRKITDSDVHEVLEHWGFSENIARINVMPEGQKYVYSDTMGAIRARSFGFGSTPPTKRYPGVPKLLCQWLADNRPKIAAKFYCTAINLNANYAGRRHRDQNNEGPSVIRAFGKFKGGKLRYFPRDTQRNPRPPLETLNVKDSVLFDLSRHTVVFNGNSAHEVEPFTGERYSVVFFTAKGYGKGKPQDVQFLKKDCGFPFPTAAELAKLKKATQLEHIFMRVARWFCFVDFEGASSSMLAEADASEAGWPLRRVSGQPASLWVRCALACDMGACKVIVVDPHPAEAV
eukprot:CAMPEP_0117486672 /NCGR_PEP_ID=MMETSP0784-20121206/15598_1 /TAXON_ID=39447 /ORGANISM="" /LENGTH=498 /DNA_ID=CAMNT_0005281291 /DNA_START=67 /DNA_END=1561 /DNA_ORIENTATION=-